MDLLPRQSRVISQTPVDPATGISVHASTRKDLHDAVRGAHDVIDLTAMAGLRAVAWVRVTIATRDRLAIWLASDDVRGRPNGYYGYVAGLRVDRSMRRGGIGRRIMQEALVQAREARALGAYLEAGPFDLGPPVETLIRFYESLGFRATGRGTEMAILWG